MTKSRTTQRVFWTVFASIVVSSPMAWCGDGGIPQDAVRQEQRFREMLAWNRRTLGDAYDKVGRKNQRWDEYAQQALDAAARNFSHVLDPQTYLWDIHNATKQAITRGCDDPLIVYLHARSFHKNSDPGPGGLTSHFVTAAEAMERSAYPPFRRAFALSKAAHQIANDQKSFTKDRVTAAERMMNASLALLSSSAAEDERTPDLEEQWFAISMSAIQVFRLTGDDHKPAFDRVDTVLSKDPALKALRLQVRGNFFIEYAWEARGTGAGVMVTEDGWKNFKERLQEARLALEEAWSLKPGDANTAARMISIETGLGGDRSDMEKWFNRAMQADGNCINACRAKLGWLDPKWHGSREEMLEFGRACRDTKNWRVGITLLVAEAHRSIRDKLPDAESKYKYMSSKEVFDDISSVYGEFCKHFPLNYAARSRYAMYCYLCGQHAISHHHFLIVGENLAWDKTFPEEFTKAARAYVAKIAPPRPGEAVQRR